MRLQVHCRICQNPVYFPYTCQCDGVVHRECLQEECEECEEFPVGKTPWLVYIIAVLFAIGQSLVDNIPMSLLPRILIIIMCSGMYILFAWCAYGMRYGDKAALLPAVCMIAYVLVSICYLNFEFFIVYVSYYLMFGLDCSIC